MIKKPSLEIEKLPASAQRIVAQYAHLSLGNKTIITPYFMKEKEKKSIYWERDNTGNKTGD